MQYFFSIVFLSFLAACNNNTPDHDGTIVTPHITIDAPKNISYTVVSQYPHDTSSFTEGLQLYNGKLYEGSGDYKNSSLRIVDLKTGKVEKKHMMGTDSIFGEGIQVFKNKIYQLTWTSHIVYVYDIKNIDKPIKTFSWPHEGWGMTNNGTDLILSDGSSNIYFVNPEDFTIKNTLPVRDDKGPLIYINELEFIDGFIYANVWQTNNIVKIDPATGNVVGRMIIEHLLQPNEFIEGSTDVLNGIAYDSTSKSMFITGKRWPKLFEIKLGQ